MQNLPLIAAIANQLGEMTSIVKGNGQSESEYSGALETELTLSLPGGGGGGGKSAEAPKHRAKRGFSATVDLNMENSSDDEASIVTRSSPPEGWPPVRSYRKTMVKSSKFVKVAVDGTPYQRKVDLEIYTSYHELLAAFEDMFTCLTICDVNDIRKIMDSADGTEYIQTYEDKDGDWMLLGDVPWKMFVESCLRLRFLKSTEAIGLAPKIISPKGCKTSSSR